MEPLAMIRASQRGRSEMRALKLNHSAVRSPACQGPRFAQHGRLEAHFIKKPIAQCSSASSRRRAGGRHQPLPAEAGKQQAAVNLTLGPNFRPFPTQAAQ
jgi:hypothetical protein